MSFFYLRVWLYAVCWLGCFWCFRSRWCSIIWTLRYNTLGSKMYPPGTNHFNPSSLLFKETQRMYLRFFLPSIDTIWTSSHFSCDWTQLGPYIILSNIGILVMFTLLAFYARNYGLGNLFVVYGVPYLVRQPLACPCPCPQLTMSCCQLTNHWSVPLLHHSPSSAN